MLAFHKCETGVNYYFWIGHDTKIVRWNQLLGRSLETPNAIRVQRVLAIKIRGDFAGAWAVERLEERLRDTGLRDGLTCYHLCSWQVTSPSDWLLSITSQQTGNRSTAHANQQSQEWPSAFLPFSTTTPATACTSFLKSDSQFRHNNLLASIVQPAGANHSCPWGEGGVTPWRRG